VAPPLSIALIGDLHGHWSEADVAYFNASNYELLLFTGDLGSGTRKNGVDIARSVARLNKRALVVAGNNDAPHRLEIAAEFRLQGGLTELMRLAPGHVLADRSEGNVVLCGYSVHEVVLGDRAFSVVVGRPYAMGGNQLSFPEALQESYGIASIAESSERLCALVEQATTEDVIFLAHNGAYGLGDEATAIWGCDFRPEAGDWGDEDLRCAVQHAKRIGKRVLAVIAGHMHRSGKLPRIATLQHDGVLFVNPAFVPRVLEHNDEVVRHHMVLELTALPETAVAITAQDVFVP
jgi:uncharacterized protein (TIGR04168 family)